MDFKVVEPGANLLAQRAAACEQMRWILAERSGLRVDMTLTRNRTSMASIRFVSERHARLRLHESFVRSPDTVQDALVGYLRTRRKKYWHTICAYARTISVPAPARITPCHTRGCVYDLSMLAEEVNTTYFDGKLDCRVGWGKRGRVMGGRSIRYGSCNVASRLIRIHPLLDDTRVPVDFVRYILYHEMLHLVIPPEYQGGRRMDHPVAFRRMERQFPDFGTHKLTAKALLRVLAT
jgi:predicted SprT family Zn-dependent metalloprotease